MITQTSSEDHTMKSLLSIALLTLSLLTVPALAGETPIKGVAGKCVVDSDGTGTIYHFRYLAPTVGSTAFIPVRSGDGLPIDDILSLTVLNITQTEIEVSLSLVSAPPKLDNHFCPNQDQGRFDYKIDGLPKGFRFPLLANAGYVDEEFHVDVTYKAPKGGYSCPVSSQSFRIGCAIGASY